MSTTAPPTTATARVGLSDLARTVNVIATAPAVRSGIAILNTVRASVTDGALELEVNTFDHGAFVRLAVAGDDMAPVLVDRVKFMQAVKAVGGGMSAANRRTADVTFRVGEHGPELCGPSGVTVNVAPDARCDVAEFPARPDLTPGHSTVHDGATLASLVHAVAPGASRADTYPVLTAIRLAHSTSGGLHLLATDRYRLHLAHTPDGDYYAPDSLVPARWLVAVSKLFKTDGRVQLVASSPRIAFTSNGATVWTTTTEGEFPSVMRLFPDETPVRFTVNRAALLAAVKAMAPLCPRNTPVHLTIGTDCIVVRNGDSESPAEAAPVPADVTDPDGIVPSVAFNPGYLADALSVTDAPMVTIGGSHRNKPFVFDHTPGVRVLVVPIRMS